MLFNELFEDYSNALRPVEDTDTVLNVTLQITLSQIKDMVSINTDYIGGQASDFICQLFFKKKSFCFCY